MPEPLQLLIVEDNPADAELLVRVLRKAGFEPEWKRVDTESGFSGSLQASLDVILCDYEMPHFSGLRALQLVNQHCPEVPLIIVSGAIGEETAVAAMRLGATDYLLKDRLGRLGPAVTHAMAERRLRREREQTEQARQLKLSELRVLFDLIPAMIWFKDTENRILRVNQRVAAAAGMRVEEIEGKPSHEIYPHDAARFYADDLEVIRSGAPKLGFVETVRGPQGDELWVQTDKMPVCDQAGKVIGIVVVARDITERRRADEAMRESEERFAGAFEHAPIGMALVSPQGRFLKVNRILCELVGYSEPELLSRTFDDITYPEDRELSAENVRRTIAGEVRSFQVEKRYVHAHGHFVTCLVNISLVRDGHGQPRYFVGQIQDITERKRAEQRIADEFNYRHTMLEASPLGIITYDGEGDVVSLNPAAAKIVGATVEQLKAQNFRNLESWKRSGLFEAADQTVKTGEPRDLETSFVTSFGKAVWLSCRFVPFRHKDRGHLLCLFSDITTRKRAEAALRASEERFRIAAETANDVIYEWDLKQGLDWLGKIDELLGYGPGEFPRTLDGWAAAVHPEDLERTKAAIQAHLEGRGPYATEYRVRRKDGVYRWWSARGRVVQTPEGKPTRWIGSITDITERKEAEETLRESERRYQTLAETSPAGVFRTDPNGQTTYVNARWCEMTGLSVEEAAGDGWLRAIHPEDREALDRGWREASAVEGVSEADYRLQRRDGSVIWVIGRAMPDRDAAGRLVGYVGTITDITERKRTEAELEQMHNQLLAVSRQAGMAEFATGVLHNVGNVLNSVNVASTCMADSLKRSKSANLAKVVALMREHETDLGTFFTGDTRGKLVPGYLAQLADQLAGEQATTLKELGELQTNIEHIKSIITVQQDSSKTAHLPDAFRLTDLVEDALRMHVNGLRRASIHLIREFEDIPPITAAKSMVLQILVNLLRNAIQACEGVGDRKRCLTIRTSQGAGRVRIAVADNGSGILPENLARLFAHGFTTKKDGHGFGLHSARLAAMEMGGSLIVESEGPSRGATFTLELPVKS